MPERLPSEQLEMKKVPEEALEYIPPDTREAVLDYAKGLRLLQHAKATAKEIEDAHERAYAYRAIATAEAGAGQDPTATFEHAKATAKGIEDANWRAYAYRAIATAEAGAGRFERAKAAAEEIEDANWRAAAYSAIAAAEAEAGQDPATFRRAKATAKEIEYADLRADAYHAIAAAEAEAGQDPTATFRRAKATAKEIEYANQRARAYSAIAAAEAEAGAKALQESRPKLSALTLEQQGQLVQIAADKNDQELLKAFGSFVDIKEQAKLLERLPQEPERYPV